MSEVIWLPSALQDFERLFYFLKNKNLRVASNFSQALKDGVKIIADFAEIGRLMDDDTGRRELFIPFGQGGYVVRYTIIGKTVLIVRVWHCK